MGRHAVARFRQPQVNSMIMEKPTINFSFKTLVMRFRRGADDAMSPDTLWRIVLGVALLGFCAVGIFAYLTYGWATSVETTTATSTKTRDAFSLPELRSVIAAYQDKESSTRQLEQHPPQAPEYRKGKGPVATSSLSSLVTPTGETLPPSWLPG